MSNFNKEFDEEYGKRWRIIFTVIVILLIVIIIGGLLFKIWPFSLFYKVANENAMIQNYEWFYDQYNAIQAQQANIKILPMDAPELPGVKMVLNNMIAEYNSKSKQITRNLWKANDLPYQINIYQEDKE